MDEKWLLTEVGKGAREQKQVGPEICSKQNPELPEARRARKNGPILE